MSTVTTFNTPNLITVKDCRDSINYYARIKLSLITIPALRTDLLALATNVNSVDQNANDILLKVGNVINTSDIEAALIDLGEMEGSVLADYKRDLNTTLNTKKNALIALRDELFKSTYNLKTMSYASNNYRLQELSSTRANLKAIATLEKDEDHYDVMLEKKQALDLAIEAYDEESFYDKALPILNQVDNVVKASGSPATFKKELLKEGVQAVKTILQLTDAAIKHDDMLKARIQLIKQINERENRRNDIDMQIKGNFDETKQLLFYEKLHEPKAKYVTEIEKILESFDSFTKVVFSGSDTVQIANRFVEHAPELKAYANRLYPAWLRG